MKLVIKEKVCVINFMKFFKTEYIHFMVKKKILIWHMIVSVEIGMKKIGV